jgi:hypothetical protein
MYNQTIHNKPMVNGHVSRTPPNAYRFVDETLLLRAFEANEPPTWSERHLFAQLAPLADKNVRYVILHQRSIGPERLDEWRDYFAFPPVFEDEQIVVYPTRFDVAPVARLTPELTLAWVGLPGGPVHQGETFSIGAVWSSEKNQPHDWGVQVRLVSQAGAIAQQASSPLRSDHPTSDWPAAAAIRGEYTLQVDPHFPPGRYTVVFALSELPDEAVVKEITLGTLEIKPLERTFTVPPLEHKTDAQFSDAVALLGYGLKQEGHSLHVTLHWQALRRMDSYKVFVHLYDAQSGALVAQNDAAPRNWTYPTDRWEAGEVVSDEIVLPLANVPAGRYRMAVGVYTLDGATRLPVQTKGGVSLGDRLHLEEVIQIP